MAVVSLPPAESTDAIAREELSPEFHLDVLLTEGIAAAVYLARKRGSSDHVAIKAIRKAHGVQDEERFAHAMRAVLTLDHPAIVPVGRWGATPRLLWFAMRFVRGRSLRGLLAHRGTLDSATLGRVLERIGPALDYAHARGVGHGNLKPENVLLDAGETAYLTDFAVARALAGKPPAVLEEDRRALAALVRECLGDGAQEPPPEWAERFPALAGARLSGKSSGRVLTDPLWKPPAPGLPAAEASRIQRPRPSLRNWVVLAALSGAAWFVVFELAGWLWAMVGP